MKICPATEKQMFTSQSAAKSCAHNCMRRRSDKLIVYQCEHCHHWHLTSRATDRMTERKKRRADPIGEELLDYQMGEVWR